ncbi:DNA methyltransferase, partial [Vibrio campbellii]|uniref:DNA methyltransferase n=2 Tax=Gammaproteobacteria TaxID=1236 RepID=UPI003AB0A857
YLTAPNIKKVDSGLLVKKGKREDGSWIIVDPSGKSERPTTSWNEKSHEAGAYGTTLLRAMLPGRKFPFPKSLYAVEDVLTLFVKHKPKAVVLDFFSGSGTTCHAVMKINKQDNGERLCISVTNNEVAAEEHKLLKENGKRPGDYDWECLGICEHITKPRIKSAITGMTPDGKPINASYKFRDEFPMSQGLDENAEFFTLTYETPISINHNLAFSKIAPLLWLRAGSRGGRIEELPLQGWDIAETYGVLADLDKSQEFCARATESKDMKIAYIVTNDDRRFQSVARNLPKNVEPVRLYEAYLNNFQFTNGE